MTIESVTNIGDLDSTKPGPADPKSEGDDHIRNLKTAVLNSFAGFAGAICVTGTDGGTANAYTLTPARALPAYGLRMEVVFSPTASSTGASTLSISGLPATPLVTVAGDPIKAGDLVAGRIYLAIYDGAQFRLAAITKNYIDQIAFSTALPPPPATTGQVFLAYENGVFSYVSISTPDFILQSQGII